MTQAQAKVTGGKLTLGYLGIITVLIGFTVLLPCTIVIAYPKEATLLKYFLLPGFGAILCGSMMSLLIIGKEKAYLEKSESALIVVASWIIAPTVAAMPFFLTGKYTFTQAMFEAISGWSTTGLSIVNVASLPHIYLFHRSLMLFFGGVGLVLIMLSILSDAHGMRLYNAEGHPDMLLPNIIKSSRLILSIYSGYILGGMLLYLFFGMNWFDALNHSIAAVATGGFSTKSNSIGSFHSLPIELVSMILMLLGTTSFMAHLFLLRGKWRRFFDYCEIRFTLFLCALCIPIIAYFLFYQFSLNVSDSLRTSAFQTISALSTTGFQTISSFAALPPGPFILFILLMLIGGQAGSTAGGMKQYRIYIMLKSVYWTFRDIFSDDRFIYANYIKRPATEELITVKNRSDIGTFLFIYMLLFFIGSLILTAFGYSLDDSLFEFSSAMGGVGLSCGITAATAPVPVLWLLSFGMLIGRLEIYVVIIAVVRARQHVKQFGTFPEEIG